MIKHWFITRGAHGDMSWFSNVNTNRYPPKETGIILETRENSA